MKMVMIIVVALLIIGGGGAGAYFYMQPKEPAADQEQVAQAEEESHEGHKSGTAYVELDPFILSVLGKHRAYQTVSIAVVIEVKSESYVEDIEAIKPKLNHYFLEEMYDSMGKDMAKGKEMSISQIQKKLLKISKEIAGDDIVNDVLIQLISKHPV